MLVFPLTSTVHSSVCLILCELAIDIWSFTVFAFCSAAGWTEYHQKITEQNYAFMIVDAESSEHPIVDVTRYVECD